MISTVSTIMRHRLSFVDTCQTRYVVEQASELKYDIPELDRLGSPRHSKDVPGESFRRRRRHQTGCSSLMFVPLQDAQPGGSIQNVALEMETSPRERKPLHPTPSGQQAAQPSIPTRVPDLRHLGWDISHADASDGDTRVVELESVCHIGGEVGFLMEEMMRRAYAYVLVYSVASRRSFEEMVGWQANLDDPEDLTWIMMIHVDRPTDLIPDKDSPSQRPKLIGVIATDCEADPQDIRVERARGADFAPRLGVEFFGVSTKTQGNVSETLQELADIYGSIRSAGRRAGLERERRDATERMQKQMELEVSTKSRKSVLGFLRRIKPS